MVPSKGLFILLSAAFVRGAALKSLSVALLALLVRALAGSVAVICDPVTRTVDQTAVVALPFALPAVAALPA